MESIDVVGKGRRVARGREQIAVQMGEVHIVCLALRIRRVLRLKIKQSLQCCNCNVKCVNMGNQHYRLSATLFPTPHIHFMP